jgi:hypothetical protein
MYKVLWFDDKPEENQVDREDALLKNIKCNCYKNSETGLKELTLNYKDYHAVILDGLFYKKTTDKGTPNDAAFGEVAKVLGNLKAQGNIIPWFIYSGQPSFVKNKSVLIDIFSEDAFANGKVFDKNKDEDFIELCNQIKVEADKLPRTKTRHNYPDIFEIFELGYLPDAVEENVLDLLIKPLPQNNSEFKAVLTNIRSIHESCFLKLSSINVVTKNITSVSLKLKHLSGNIKRENNWKPTSEVYQSKEILNLNEWIYYTCGTYLHYLEDQHYDGYMISNYAVESLKFGLLEILLWFKKVYEENK